MVSHLFYYQIALLAIVWLFIMLHLTWSTPVVRAPATPAEPEPIKPKHRHSNEPKAFEGLTKKPHCALCERDTVQPQPPAPVAPDPMAPTNRRPRTVDTSEHFCPHSGCDYWGWRGLGVSGTRNWVETVDVVIRTTNRPMRVSPDGPGAPLATPLEAGFTRRVSPSCDNSCL